MVDVFSVISRALVVTLICIFSPYTFASVDVEKMSADPSGCSELILKKDGSIRQGDTAQFVILYSRFVAKVGKDGCIFKRLHLTSEGGDVQEALLLGMKVREFEFHTIVPRKGCFSACVFVYAAGVNRVPFGPVGIHRPYYSSVSPSASSVEIRRERDQLSVQIKKFLNAIDVSDNLWEDMQSIPPERMKILSEAELEKYRILGLDATFDERMTAIDAAEYGVTSAEYRRRDHSAQSVCKKRDSIGLYKTEYDCAERIKRAISQSELQRRRDKVLRMCMVYENQPGKFRTCRNEIMRGD